MLQFHLGSVTLDAFKIGIGFSFGSDSIGYFKSSQIRLLGWAKHVALGK